MNVEQSKDLVQKAVELMRDAGAKYADARVVKASAFVAVASKTKVVGENPSTHGICLRAFHNGWGYYSANAITDLKQAAEHTVNAAKKLPKNPGFEEEQGIKQDFFETAVKKFVETNLTDLVDTANRLNKDFLAQKNVLDAQTALTTSLEEVTLANSFGSLMHKEINRTRFGVMAVAGDGVKQREYYHSDGAVSGAEYFDKADLHESGRKVCNRARELLNAVQCPKDLKTVILLGEGGGSGLLAHEAVGHAVEGDYAAANRSFFNNKIDTQVGVEELSLVDDGTHGSGWGEVIFDDEGTLAQKTHIIRDGFFKTFLHDRRTASQYGVKSTGNARAQDAFRRVYVRMRNTYIEPRDWQVEEIISDTKNGVLCNHWKAGIEEPAEGSFQMFFVDGYLIKNGEITDSLYNIGVTQSSTLDGLKKIDAIGRDFHSDVGGCGKGHSDYVSVGSGGPTIRINDVVIGA